jgi:DNA-binding NtrC family response regulator
MKTILVVDDESRIRRIYATLLTAEGYNVIESSNGIDANEALRKEPIDLVLLDLRMPEINGNILYDVLMMFHKKVRVIVSSVYHVDRQKKIIPFAAEYHDKSQGIDDLLNKIQMVLKDESLVEKVI